MAIITFVNNLREETGKTMSLVAVATNMALEYNNKILVISTSDHEEKINSCFFENEKVGKFRKSLLPNVGNILDNQTGIQGLSTLIRSNRLTPEMITNYTKVVFRDRLEVILGTKMSEISQEIEKDYVELIKLADMYYDKIFIDLDDNISESIRQEIINKSDIVILNSSQNYTSLRELKENKDEIQLLKSPKTLLLVGRYDKFSKYNSKNITRYLEEKNQVLTIPYNTLYFEASNEGNVAELFLNFRKLSDQDDRNAIFINEVKRVTQNIIYRMEELQTLR